jgi:hypothetical protein
MTKLKIDLQTGALEVEGEESFVRDIYQDFKDKISLNTDSTPKKTVGKSFTEPQIKDISSNSKKGKKEVGKRKETYKILSGLDLNSGSDKKSLKEFYSEKKPSSIGEKDTVFVYYLEKIAKIQNITIDHVFTCYKEVGQKVPNALRQSLLDASSRKGWLNTSSLVNMTVPIRGQNLIEHDLEKDKESKK